MWPFKLVSAAIVVLLVSLASIAVFAEHLIYKCCQDGYYLNNKEVCVKGGPLKWAPVVYSPSERSFLHPGTVPSDWHYQLSRPKQCATRPTFFEHELNVIYPPPFVLVPNGSLILSSDVTIPIAPENYCIDSKGALICFEQDDTKNDSITVQKCCGIGGEYSEIKESCSPAENDHPDFKTIQLKTVERFPDCSELNYVIGGKLNTTHWLQEDGTLKDNGGRILLKTQYCLEKILEYPEQPIHIFTCPARVKPRHTHDIRFTLYPMGLFLSVFFLAVTLIASCLLPSTYHVLHWRCQTNHVACLLIGDLLLAVTQLSSDALQGPACIGIAISMHFIFLAAFFWLNTMCFNIWWTFRDLRPASLDKGQEACRLRVYELYAWGGPLTIATVAAILDNLPDGSHPNFLKPRFGQQRCWFYGDAELLSYFFGPIGVLLLLNVTLFAATARELTCGLWKTEVVKSNTERATLGRVCLKLVVVMGVTWVADVVSWAVGGPDYVWYLTDLINALQGVLIFAVVGCQPQVWAAVKRLWCLAENPTDGNNVRSSSSHALPSLNDHNTTVTKPVETLC